MRSAPSHVGPQPCGRHNLRHQPTRQDIQTNTSVYTHVGTCFSGPHRLKEDRGQRGLVGPFLANGYRCRCLLLREHLPCSRRLLPLLSFFLYTSVLPSPATFLSFPALLVPSLLRLLSGTQTPLEGGASCPHAISSLLLLFIGRLLGRGMTDKSSQTRLDSCVYADPSLPS